MNKRIAISANDNRGLDSAVSDHFGRCPYFVIAEIEENAIKSVEAIENPFFHSHRPGQVPGFIHSHNVDVMLTGGMGHRAVDFFQQYGIQPVTGAAGTVHIGASGVIFGYLGFLMARGFFERSVSAILLSAGVIWFFHAMVWGLLPTVAAGISWEAHLFGFLGGIMSAWLLRPRRAPAGT